MIKLDVEDYCHNCNEFEPDVHREHLYFAGKDKLETVVRCEHRIRCESIKNYLEGKIRSNDIG